MKKVIFLAVFTLSTVVMYAGGYRVSLQGQNSLAMGHAGVAEVNSSELVFFNPAGLVYLENKLAAVLPIAPGYGNAAGVPTGAANPYYARFATSASSTVIADAASLSPTFLVYGLGIMIF